MSGNEETRRIYIRGLFEGVTEDDIKLKFGRFGDIRSVEIKVNNYNDAQNTFAFVEMTAMPNNFNKCLTTFSKTRWKGSELKLEMAKESFLKRLQREREAQNTNDGESKHVEPSDPLPTHLYGNSDSESRKSHCVPRFMGIKDLKNKNDAAPLISSKSMDLKVSVDTNDNCNVLPVGDVNSDFMSRLEKFSGGVWSDDRPDPSFEIVKEGWSSNKLAAETKGKGTFADGKTPMKSTEIRSRSANKQQLSNEKRLHSLQLKQSAEKTQQNIVKEALSKVSTPNKKVFSTSDDEGDGSKNERRSEIEVEVDRQNAEETVHHEPYHISDEPSRGSEKRKRHWTEFISERYDPTSEDCSKYELKGQSNEMQKEHTGREWKKKKKGEEGPEVSSERFFNVSDGLRNVFTNKSDKPFSFTQLFGSKEETKTFSKTYERNSFQSTESDEARSDWKQTSRRWPEDDRQTDRKPWDEMLATTSEDVATEVVMSNSNSLASDTFFLFTGDARLKEGVESFRQREDLAIIEEKWRARRDELRMFVRGKRKKMAEKMKSQRSKPKMGNAHGKKKNVKLMKERKGWNSQK